MREMKEDSAGHRNASLGDEIVGRINELAAISETPEHLARVFLTKEHPCGGRSDPDLDALGRHARASRCDRKCLRALRRRAAGSAMPDAGLALRLPSTTPANGTARSD